MALLPQNVTVKLAGLPDGGAIAATGELTVLTGPGPLVENSFEEPLKARPPSARRCFLNPSVQGPQLAGTTTV